MVVCVGLIVPNNYLNMKVCSRIECFLMDETKHLTKNQHLRNYKHRSTPQEITGAGYRHHRKYVQVIDTTGNTCRLSTPQEIRAGYRHHIPLNLNNI